MNERKLRKSEAEEEAAAGAEGAASAHKTIKTADRGAKIARRAAKKAQDTQNAQGDAVGAEGDNVDADADADADASPQGVGDDGAAVSCPANDSAAADEDPTAGSTLPAEVPAGAGEDNDDIAMEFPDTEIELRLTSGASLSGVSSSNGNEDAAAREPSSSGGESRYITRLCACQQWATESMFAVL